MGTILLRCYHTYEMQYKFRFTSKMKFEFDVKRCDELQFQETFVVFNYNIGKIYLKFYSYKVCGPKTNVTVQSPTTKWEWNWLKLTKTMTPTIKNQKVQIHWNINEYKTLNTWYIFSAGIWFGHFDLWFLQYGWGKRSLASYIYIFSPVHVIATCRKCMQSKQANEWANNN